MHQPVSDRVIYTVSQLNSQIRQLLETLPLLWLEGEISNLSKPSSGHWYFTLKDAQAQIRCAMFRNRSSVLKFAPRDGDRVLVRAKVSLYEGRGDYQLIVEHMEPAGLGDLQRQFEMLKNRLEQEGLFDADTKLALPMFASRIGLVTSPTGAAVRDILQILGRRFPAIPVVILPVSVQGRDASREIAQAIALANKRQLCDVLIVGRGGGSMEDLWAFNEEIVARAIAVSQIPVISAVGHETDFTIADFVADLRAPTPSAAAELAVPNQEEVHQILVARLAHLRKGLNRQLEKAGFRLDHLRARLQHPGHLLRSHQQKIDLSAMRLNKAWQTNVHRLQQRLLKNTEVLQHRNPRQLLALRRQQLNQLQQRLPLAWQQLKKTREQRLARTAALLHGLSPLPTLQRGYVLALDEQQGVIRSAEDVSSGDHLRLKFHDGEVHVQAQ